MLKKSTKVVVYSMLATVLLAGCDIELTPTNGGENIITPLEVSGEDIDEPKNVDSTEETDGLEGENEGTDVNENPETPDNFSNDASDNGNNDAQGDDNSYDDDGDVRIYDAEEEFTLFLNGEKNCKIADHEKAWMLEFDNTKEYSLSDIIQVSEDGSFVAEDVKVESVSYSFIDCGLDGKTDLAVCLDYDPAQSPTDYFIFTLKNGEIYLVDYEYSYYVYFTDILDTGFISYSGRENAVTHFWGYGFVNADGEYVYDYEIYEQAALPTPLIPDTYLPNDFEGYAEETYDENGEYFADVYNFTTFTYDYDDVSSFEEYYNEYKSHNMATFYDYDGNNVEPSDELKKFYDDNEIYWYTESEIDELVADHEDEIGLTDEIKNGEAITWTVLE